MVLRARSPKDSGTAPFSFEGTNLTASSLHREATRSSEVEDPPIFENCIEKNFHVPNMKADRNGLSVPLWLQFREIEK